MQLTFQMGIRQADKEQRNCCFDSERQKVYPRIIWPLFSWSPSNLFHEWPWNKVEACRTICANHCGLKPCAGVFPLCKMKPESVHTPDIPQQYGRPREMDIGRCPSPTLHSEPRTRRCPCLGSRERGAACLSKLRDSWLTC